jgi:hypothetical protein
MQSKGVRLLVGFYALYWVGRYWFWWSTVNLPQSAGGTLDNPFNDPLHICCVYDAVPCERNLYCTIGGGTQAFVPRIQYQPILPWIAYAIALCAVLTLEEPLCFVVAGLLLWGLRTVTL